MKIDLDTIGFTEGRKLKIAHYLMYGGIAVTAVGLITTFAGRLILTKTSTWTICLDPINKKQIVKLYNAFYNPERV